MPLDDDHYSKRVFVWQMYILYIEKLRRNSIPKLCYWFIAFKAIKCYVIGNLLKTDINVEMVIDQDTIARKLRLKRKENKYKNNYL